MTCKESAKLLNGNCISEKHVLNLSSGLLFTISLGLYSFTVIRSLILWLLWFQHENIILVYSNQNIQVKRVIPIWNDTSNIWSISAAKSVRHPPEIHIMKHENSLTCICKIVVMLMVYLKLIRIFFDMFNFQFHGAFFFLQDFAFWWQREA